jgi:flagellar motor switch protein FliN/FliY
MNEPTDPANEEGQVAADNGNVSLEELSGAAAPGAALDDDQEELHTASELEAVFDVPVNVSAVLGKTHLPISRLLRLSPGEVLELDRKVGEAIDIFVNNRLVARGEVVLVEERLGVTMTEIIKGDGN